MAPKRISMVGSLGGHLELLIAATPALEGHDVTWVTSEGVRAAALRSEGRRVRALPRLDRRSVRLVSVLMGMRMAVTERPEVIVTSGAGFAVPFSLVARVLGAKLIFIETMARVNRGSRTGKLLTRIASAVIVQWPELQAETYPAAVVCRPLLLEGVGASPAAGASGTFVTVGSHDVPFDRLLRMVEDAAAAGVLPSPVFVQHGVGRRPAGTDGAAWLDPEEFRERVGNAELVIAHGGAGAVATALRAGRRPIVIPRSERAGEHVDDHQTDLVAKLASLGLIVEVTTGAIAAEHVDAVAGPARFDLHAQGPSVIDVLRQAITPV